MNSSNRTKIAWERNAQRLKLSNRRLKNPVTTTKKQTHSKKGWYEFGGKRLYARSTWEANFARYLQWQKERGMIKEWLHEPKTFWFEGIRRGCVTYLPDFQVIKNDDSHEWVEVKGFMDSKSLTKIKRFHKFFPKEFLRIVDAKWYKANRKKLSLIIPGWEKG